MNIINLPPVLPGELDLEAINRSLLANEILLDWSRVENAPEEQLAVLLAGLDLVEHSEILGVETVPDSLSDDVLRVLLSGSESPSPRHGKRKRPNDNSSAPVTWVPEQQTDLNGVASVDRDEQPRTAQPPPEPPRSILQPLSPSALRDELERLVLQDLLGPAGGPEEEIDEGSVRDRYLVGALAPRDQQVLPEEMDELAIPEEGSVEDGANDDAVLHIASLYPSSIGMSFSVDGTAASLSVEAGWGFYKREHSETIKTPKGAPKMVWKRQQISGKSNSVPLKVGPIPSWSPEAEEQPDVVVRGLIRRSEDCWTVTLFLVNEQREPEKRRDEAWVFQPELSVSAPDGAPIFQRRSPLGRRQSDEELAMSMLYRRHMSFAIGHGVGVHAETVAGDPTRAVRLATRVVPTYDVPRTEAPTTIEIPGLTDLVLDMKELAACPVAALAGKLMPLVTSYAAWIAEQTARIDDPQAGLAIYRRAAEQAMEECQRTLVRIKEGIALLSKNRHAAQAFSFMNRAMWQQRIHTLYAEERRRGQSTSLEEKDRAENRSWRPFQLAFILLNLPALTDLHHPDRSEEASAMADLLWFPTGGGKTEAYLGLTAYTLAIRRLQGTIEGRSGEEGVAVIMRYTLRLLTLQQFQRATALICACEDLRREDKQRTWGATPFRLGLWVGQRTTPNTTEQSEEASRQDRGVYQRGSTIGGVGSPRQLTNCPWCGSPIDAGRDIKIEPFAKGRGRTFIYCGDLLGRCPFSRKHSPEGLPVLVVDEEIYRCLPALLIATVDKFAQMPWNGATQMLFGQVDKQCSRHGFHCPDLEDKDLAPCRGRFPSGAFCLTRPTAAARPDHSG